MKKLFLVLLFALFAGAAYYGYTIMYPKPLPKPENTSDKPMTYTLAQVAEHANRESCWLAIEGKVYDVTPFVASGFHPGKDAILEGCGKDATTLFNTRPMGSGTAHSDKARGSLPKFVIGDLEQ